MRKVLFYADAVPTTKIIDAWAETKVVLRELPQTKQQVGYERQFSTWLTIEDCRVLQTLTLDELSRYLAAAPRDLCDFLTRAPTEVYVQLALEIDVMTPRELEKLSAHCFHAQRKDIRTYRHFSEMDALGRCQEFLNPDNVEDAIEEFCRVWNGPVDQYGVPKAAWLLVALLNAHPFKDGNGRLARSLFNASLIREGLISSPIPLGPLIFATHGNFELAMRRAEITNDWEPVCKALRTLISYYSKMVKRAGSVLAK